MSQAELIEQNNSEGNASDGDPLALTLYSLSCLTDPQTFFLLHTQLLSFQRGNINLLDPV